MRLLLSSIVGLLICAVVLLQHEIEDLKTQVSQADQRAASAVKQFETDLLAKIRADESTWLAAQALGDKQRAAVLNEGLKHLPTRDLDKPLLWGALPK